MAEGGTGTQASCAHRSIITSVLNHVFVSFRERNIPEIESMYEGSFPKLSDRYFKQGPWPPVDAISDLVDQDHVFCLLYKVWQQQQKQQQHAGLEQQRGAVYSTRAAAAAAAAAWAAEWHCIARSTLSYNKAVCTLGCHTLLASSSI
jgi:hypothetical protein